MKPKRTDSGRGCEVNIVVWGVTLGTPTIPCFPWPVGADAE
ncbi:hypothetical protein LCGC14_1301900 [marine sediment metagenome]|uniref:Uncharacterized protein n=1 Tax=marine sediment metagenome TaxID=412755 RepID=A0A0F9KQN7_9ZZZZ